MLVKTRAIVLHFIKYAETSIILSLYTDKFGRQTVIVNSVYTSKPKFPPSFFLPLTLLELDIYHKAGREIQRIKEISCSYHFHSIPFQINKGAIALFISEVLYKTIKEEEANQKLFDFLVNAIQLLDLKESGIQNFHISFLIQLLKYIGLYPFKPDSHDLMSEELSAILPPNSDVNLINGMKQLCQYSLGQLENVKINHETRTELLENIINYYHLHFGYTSSIKSLDILKNTFR
jgi:DNA repair protein RecO (recombination protein O)